MISPDDHLALLKRAGERVAEMARADPQLAALIPRDDVTRAVEDPALSYQQIVSTILAGYAERPALGSRTYEVVIDEETAHAVRHYLPSYDSVTYGTLAHQVEAVASFWQRSPRHGVAAGDMVAFIAFNGMEMTAVDLACIYANAIAVPLQANYSARDLDEILSDTAPVTLVASIDNLDLAVTHALKHASIRSLIVIDADMRVDTERSGIEAARARLAGAGDRIALATFAQAIEEGEKTRFEPLPAPEGGRERMVMTMYTSGSTGTPKGAIIHEAIPVRIFTARRPAVPVMNFIFGPMNHSMGRNSLYGTLAAGGTAYFTQKSDLSTMLEDIQLARPTTLAMIPRICELAQQHHLAEVNKRVARGEEPEAADRAVRAAMRSGFLGDRLTSALLGSAPTTPELRQFMCEVFDIPIIDTYGNTEAGGITSNSLINADQVTDFKLVDVPELGYYTSDKPHPRGELLVKTKNMIQGYYKRPEATAAIFDPDGFLMTGDIMEQPGPQQLVWLDRRNNVMKLAQGEYVAIGPLESTFLGHGKVIDQIYIYGNSTRPFLLAVVVPNRGAAHSLLGCEPSDADLRRLVLEDMRETARKTELKSFELPRDVLIECEPFALANGLLSAVGKPLRANLKNRYGEALEAIYAEMDRKLSEERGLLSEETAGQSTLERVVGVLKFHLGLADLDADSAANYAQLGGDSLGAVNLTLLLDEIFGISVPVTNILHPDASPRRLAEQIDALLTGSDLAARYDVIHPDPDYIRADDLALGALFGEAALSAAAAALPAVDEARTVLITGANGFLGRFLCLEWLERIAPVGGKVICLIRGSDERAVRKRLDEVFDGVDRTLAGRFTTLAASHLEVIPADLSAPNLGLDAATFARLASEVDQIVHIAALVNHRLSYRNLFEPNVLGTAELVRLALSNRLKRFDYVSSIAVASISPDLARAEEDADVRALAAKVLVAGDHYAMGYSASKWAGEVILRSAHEMFGLPVNVFRAGMILPHSRYQGQINPPDSFIRLLASLIMTGLAPKSFYRPGVDGGRAKAHYDGLPVDFVAAIMQQIGVSRSRGFQTYNLVNMHYDDGISLDSMADWIIDAGYELLRVDDHDEWFRRFGERMRTLPDEMRRHSCLAILAQFRTPYGVEPKKLAHAQFLARVRELPVGPQVPHLSQAYIHKCIDGMRILGLVGDPAPVPACPVPA